MNLKQEFLAAWQSAASHDALLELVSRHEAAGVTPDDAYRTLEEIWTDRGYRDVEDDSELRNNLEYVMEKVWYYGRELHTK